MQNGSRRGVRSLAIFGLVAFGVCGGGVRVGEAQPEFGGGDPTPQNPVICGNTFTPQAPTGTLVCDWPLPNPPLQGALANELSTWIPPTTNPMPWQPFRQPAIFIQLWNGSHQLDPMGLAWWWGRFDRATEVSLGDAPRRQDTNEDLRRLVRNENTGEPEDLVLFTRPDGQPGNGKIDRWEAFEWYLDHYYNDYGYRRFILKLPAGNVFNQDFPVNQWQLLPAWKQDLFLNPNSPFNQWRARPEHADAVFEVYIGGPIPLGLCTPCFGSNTFNLPQLNPPPPNPFLPLNGIAADTTTPNVNGERVWRVSCPNIGTAEQFVPWNQRHVNMMVESIKPWVDANIKGIWLDALNENEPSPNGRQRRRGVLELSYMPYLRARGVRIGAETFPDRWFINPNGGPGGGNADWIDDCAVAFTRWIGLSQVATTWNPNAPYGQRRQFKPESQGWFFDRTRTEVLLAAVAVRNSAINRMEDPYTFQEIGEARRRGFVIAQYNIGEFKFPVGEFVKRWYSMGKIRVADFDGNGDVITDPNSPLNDRNQFLAAYNAAVANPNGVLRVFAQGDANGDEAFGINDIAFSTFTGHVHWRI